MNAPQWISRLLKRWFGIGKKSPLRRTTDRRTRLHLEVLEDRTLLSAVVWASQFGTNGADEVTAMVASGSDLYVIGNTSGALPGQVSAGSTDAFLRKYDATGSIAWTVQFGTNLINAVDAVAVDATGVYVAGHNRGVVR